DRQAYAADTPVDPYNKDTLNLHVAAAGGSEVARSFVHLAVDGLPPGSSLTGASLRLVPNGDQTQNVNTDKAIVQACVPTQELAAQFDPGHPPPHDCSKGSPSGPASGGSGFPLSSANPATAPPPGPSAQPGATAAPGAVAPEAGPPSGSAGVRTLPGRRSGTWIWVLLGALVAAALLAGQPLVAVATAGAGKVRQAFSAQVRAHGRALLTSAVVVVWTVTYAVYSTVVA